MSAKGLALGIVIGGSVGASLGKSFQTLEDRAKRANQNLKKARIGETLAKDMLKYKKTLVELKAKQESLGRTSPKLEKGIADVTRRYRAAKSQAKAYGMDISRLADEHKRLGREAGKAEKQLAKVGRRKRLGQVFSEAKGQLAAMAGAGYTLSRQAASAQRFGRVQTRLGTVINADDRGAALNKSRSTASRFARGSLATEEEVLNSEYALNSAGLNANASRSGAQMVHKLATVTGGQSEQVGEVVGDVFNNLSGGLEGSDGDKMTRIGDLLAKTQFKFAIRDFGQLGEGIRYAAAPLAQYNVDLEQGVTLIGKLNSVGLKGSQAGTALAASFRSMSKASEELGFDMARNDKGGLDYIQTLQNMSDAIGGFDNMDQDTIDQLQLLFGDEGVRSVSLLGKQLGSLPKDLRDVAGAIGAVNESYGSFLNDDQGEWDRLTGNFGSLGRSIGTSLMPVITPVVGGMADLFGWLGNVIDQTPVAGVAIGSVAAGFVAYKTVTLGAALATGNFGKALDILSHKQARDAIGRLSKVKGLMSGIGRVGAVGAAGAGGYAAGTYLYDNVLNQETKDGVGEAMARVAAFFGSGEAKDALAVNGIEGGMIGELKSLFGMASDIKPSVTQTTQITINPTANQSPREIAEEIARIQQEQQQGALYDVD